MAIKLQYRIVMMCLCLGLGQSSYAEVCAKTMYSYVDDQGNLAYTDSPETIPEKYRAKVKTHEQPDPISKPASRLEPIQQKIREQAKSFGWEMPSLQMTMAGFTPAQSKIVNYAGAAAVGLLLLMYFTKGPFMRMLGFCLLIIIGIGAPVLIYVSDDGPMDTMKKKATASGEAQQDRLRQVP